jgi:uncharacterized protein (TIGR01244 family)
MVPLKKLCKPFTKSIVSKSVLKHLSYVIPNFKQPRPLLITGGQPEANAWRIIANAGVSTIVNLRCENELPGRNVAKEVRDANLIYINMPIEGPDNLTLEKATELLRILNHAEGAVLLHCGTGNRCGAMLALTEAWLRQRDIEEAVLFGKQAGLMGLEPAVRAILKKA